MPQMGSMQFQQGYYMPTMPQPQRYFPTQMRTQPRWTAQQTMVRPGQPQIAMQPSMPRWTKTRRPSPYDRSASRCPAHASANDDGKARCTGHRLGWSQTGSKLQVHYSQETHLNRLESRWCPQLEHLQQAVMIQGQEPLTATMLAAAPLQEQKQMLGEIVSNSQHAPQICG